MSRHNVFCMECKQSLGNYQKARCSCGSRDFVFGSTLTIVNDKFVCSCGSDKMTKVAHMSASPKYLSTYQCCGCGANISKEIYYKPTYV